MVINFDEYQDGQMIWRYPMDNFTKDATLIVPQGCEAIVLVDGVCEERYVSGKYELIKDTRNFFAKLFSNKEKSAVFQVYYVNKNIEVKAKWGTPQPVEFRDPESGIPVMLGANGTYKIRIEQPLKVYERLMGQKKNFTIDMVSEYFSDEIKEIVGDVLVNVMADEGKGFYDISKDLRKLSDRMEEQIGDRMRKYGFGLESFIVAGLVYSDEVKSLLTEYATKAYKYKMDKTQRAAEKDERLELRAEQRDDIEYDLNIGLKTLKETSQVEREDITVVGGVISQINKSKPIAETNNQDNKFVFCANCGVKNPSEAKFCNNCGKSVKAELRCRCGALIPAGSRFCNGCGNKVEDEDEDEDEDD